MRLSYFAAIGLLSCACIARADNVQTLGEFNGNASYNDPGPYQPPTIVGTFNILPGDGTVTISGTFGNSTSVNSSGVDLYLGSVLVAQCVEFSVCWNDGSTWSDTLTSSQIASLGTGTVDFTAVQTSEFTVRLGDTTLDQAPTTAATPEPSSFALLGTGLLGFAGVVRRRFIR